MPSQSNGHAYGRVMAHPHCGLHLGAAHAARAATHGARSMGAVSHKHSAHDSHKSSYPNSREFGRAGGNGHHTQNR